MRLDGESGVAVASSVRHTALGGSRSATADRRGRHRPGLRAGRDARAFDYRVTGLGAAAICRYPNPVPNSPEDIAMPPGTPLDYTLTVLVGIPQITLP